MTDMRHLVENSTKAAQLLKAMSNEKRLMILCLLGENELSVSQINASVPLSQSALSQHLTALRTAKLVETRRESQVIYYRVASDAPKQIIHVLKAIYCPPAGDNA